MARALVHRTQQAPVDRLRHVWTATWAGLVLEGRQKHGDLHGQQRRDLPAPELTLHCLALHVCVDAMPGEVFQQLRLLQGPLDLPRLRKTTSFRPRRREASGANPLCAP